MIDASIQAVFAIVFGVIARYCLPRGWMFLRMGWFAIRTYSDAGNVRENVERQRGISSGTSFFLAGLGWFSGGLIAAGLGVVLLLMAASAMLNN